ncbi:hypothetical protein [Tropicimonas sp. IMCC34043]|uniref:hypothetical protein n=1 Tax=Tropicimonas sp. IMCC34043 TaxID=2248760 RepID=UPI000E21D015|nr:hypothetical protein [Tropicimonas sp. IMCC34043]
MTEPLALDAFASVTTAVTKRYGPSPMAFGVLPLVSAFFIDIVTLSRSSSSSRSEVPSCPIC